MSACSNCFAATFDLRRSLLSSLARHRETIFAVHTHTQRAQPTTVAHYLLAVVEQLERDAARLTAAYERTNRNPLGACAITGTGFPIDRQLTSDLLGFDGPTVNTYGSIATVDYLLESASAAAVLLAGHGRFVQDLLLWSTVRIPLPAPGRRLRAIQQHHAAEAQPGGAGTRPRHRQQSARTIAGDRHRASTTRPSATSSIPKTICSRWSSRCSAMPRAPCELVAAAMATAQFDAPRLEARAGDGWTTLTELADTLARDRGLPFRTAHAICRTLDRPAADTSGKSAPRVAG